MTDLSPNFGIQVPGLPQNHDVVKARYHKQYTNFRRANNMTQLSLVTCRQKLTFPSFRRVLMRLTKLEFVKLQVMVQKQALSYLRKKDNCTL
jgi:hypothetical protein